MRRAWIALAEVATVMQLLPAPAWGTSADTPPGHPASARASADTAHVQVHDQFFSPATVAVPRGGTVVFDFVGDGHHTATDASGLDLYDSGLVDGGGPSMAAVFAAAGAYRFTCTPHPSMGGRVEVPVRAAPANGGVDDRYLVTWASDPAVDGFAHDVQVRRPGGRWRTWRDGVVGASRRFRADAGPGVYRFRARLADASGEASLWSLPASITVR